MRDSIFNEKDLKQIESKGMKPEKVLSQIKTFKKGFPFSRLIRPCTLGDGIKKLTGSEIDRFCEIYSDAALSGRGMKFVPASGAASRMFKDLISAKNLYEQIRENGTASKIIKEEVVNDSFLKFINGLKDFAFYDRLKEAMSGGGLDIDNLATRGEYRDILGYMLTPKGMNLSSLPKGLIEFHKYPGYSRTPMEEHLVEAKVYVKDRDDNIRVHFTISPEHEGLFESHLEEILKRLDSWGDRYDISFSIQDPSTDSIAVDTDNIPFRQSDGSLLFRPAGHGALLQNLSRLKGDIIFIKNIDNVVPDRIKQTTYTFKMALGGYLVEIQERLFHYLKILTTGDTSEILIKEISDFAKDRLSLILPEEIAKGSLDNKIAFFISRLNRPLRICGMVKNEGEPGGGPFWIEGPDGDVSLQIVESSQVDMECKVQREIWESSTHFNPVDLVCGVRDHMGRPFDLMDYTDPETGLISAKSKEGRELKALELPGLWNGSMANWNTIFIEVPIITFNPVKTVLDLLRREHQPG